MYSSFRKKAVVLLLLVLFLSGCSNTPKATIPSPTPISTSSTTMKTFAETETPFTFSYPDNWLITHQTAMSVSISSPEVVKSRETNPTDCTTCAPDVIITYYPTIADERNNKNNNLGAQTWQELLDKDHDIMVTGEVQISGMQAIAVVQIARAEIFAYYFPRGDALYVVQFPHRKDSVDLSATESAILDSLKLLK